MLPSKQKWTLEMDLASDRLASVKCLLPLLRLLGRVFVQSRLWLL